MPIIIIIFFNLNKQSPQKSPFTPIKNPIKHKICSKGVFLEEQKTELLEGEPAKLLRLESFPQLLLANSNNKARSWD